MLADVYNLSAGTTKSDLDIVVMDSILARTIRKVKVKRRRRAKLVDTPVEMYARTSVENLHFSNPVNAQDYPSTFPDYEYYRACIIVIPDAGVFYCHRKKGMYASALRVLIFPWMLTGSVFDQTPIADSRTGFILALMYRVFLEANVVLGNGASVAWMEI
jgi:hypothetical protein